ncbi:hemerythrin domain-containing protein [Pseudothauera rhizosphaerae]|uniref:Hemerythrin domain-containing protein n=1 Tax=Pseudothauera rhizosphaerae TaxID=2565932 RepID=A0A4S4AYB7_9RHOO|nr:hemerythrin domain-containing protein [Pseudothauera rhizosphaerae]THF65136.1 hemerythrin domain-containing protein [Pseudothauera rhizosphaerae]
MEALRIIEDEHQSLAAILHAVRYMLKEIGQGKLQPDFRLLRAMVHYLDAYPEQRHHPKEDQYLFARLKARTNEGADAIARLEQEHAGGEARIKALEAALHQYASGDRDGFDAFGRAFENFADFYRNHMLLEEREVLPLCRKHFTEEDWEAVAAGFRDNNDPMGGTRETEDFRRIFSKLVAAAPPPIGLGGGPYEDD